MSNSKQDAPTNFGFRGQDWPEFLCSILLELRTFAASQVNSEVEGAYTLQAEAVDQFIFELLQLLDSRGSALLRSSQYHARIDLSVFIVPNEDELSYTDDESPVLRKRINHDIDKDLVRAYRRVLNQRSSS